MDNNNDNDLVQRLRTQAVTPFGPEGFDLLTQAASEIERLAAQVAQSQSAGSARQGGITSGEISAIERLCDRIEQANEGPILVSTEAASAIRRLIHAAHIAGTSQATKAQAEPSAWMVGLQVFKTWEQAHVMPPPRGTDSQLDAGIAHGDIVAAYTRWMHDSSQFPHSDDTRHPFEAFSAGVKAACRGRAQGGITSKENGSDVAPTTSTVSAPTVRVIDVGQGKQLRREAGSAGWHGWTLHDDEGAMIRWLNIYEKNFIDSAIRAALRTSTDQANADTGSAE